MKNDEKMLYEKYKGALIENMIAIRDVAKKNSKITVSKLVENVYFSDSVWNKTKKKKIATADVTGQFYAAFELDPKDFCEPVDPVILENRLKDLHIIKLQEHDNYYEKFLLSRIYEYDKSNPDASWADIYDMFSFSWKKGPNSILLSFIFTIALFLLTIISFLQNSAMSNNLPVLLLCLFEYEMISFFNDCSSKCFEETNQLLFSSKFLKRLHRFRFLYIFLILFFLLQVIFF